MRLRIWVLLILQAMFVLPLAAQEYPNKTVRLIVPFAAGGVADIIGRLLSQPMGQALGAGIYVDNRPGAGGMIGTEELAKAPPDGYSLIVQDMAFTISAQVYPKVAYNPASDFTPISLVAKTPQWLFVSAATPIRNLSEFIAAARKDPGKYSIGSSGNGTGTHLMAELLMREAGIQLIHVPYKGAGPSVTAASTGEITAVFAFMPVAAPFVQSGRLRAIAVTTETRVAGYTDVPTFMESGLNNMVVEHWLGIMGPAGLQPAVLNKVNAAVKAAIKDATVEQRFKSLALEPVASTPEDLGALVRSDLKRWGAVVRDAKIKVQ